LSNYDNKIIITKIKVNLAAAAAATGGGGGNGLEVRNKTQYMHLQGYNMYCNA
jgi:hypothetical protein